MSDEVGAQAELLGRLTGAVNSLPRDEFGERYSLAIDAAYRRVEALLVAELRTACRQP